MGEMTKEQFLRKWEDTHPEMSALETLSAGRKSKIKHPEDKGIRVNSKKIPGQALLNQKSIEVKRDSLSHLLLDSVFVKAKELLEADVTRLAALAIKATPQQIQATHQVLDNKQISLLLKATEAIEAEFEEV